MTIARKPNLNKLRQCSREWQFCSLFYALESEERGEKGYMKSTGGRLRGWEKVKWGNLWARIESKTEKHVFPVHRWVPGS